MMYDRFVMFFCMVDYQDMEWATRRRSIYAIGTIAFLIASGVYFFRATLFPVPTCFDSKKNGMEAGIDCDGACALRCTASVAPLVVEWSRIVPIGPKTYDLVAMIANKNTTSAPLASLYTFTLTDAQGMLLGTYTGTTSVLVGSSFPLIVQNITLPQAPAHMSVDLTPTPFYVTGDQSTFTPIRITDTSYEPGDITRVHVVVRNTTRSVFLQLPLRVIVYDDTNNAIGVGESIIPKLNKEEEKDIVFTWPNGFAHPSKIRAYPIIDPFTGNM